MSERRRRRRRQNNKTEAFWITALVAVGLAGVFIWLVVLAAYTGGGRKPTDSNIAGPVITVPNTGIQSADAGTAVPIIVTEPNRPPAGPQNQKTGGEGVRYEDRGIFEPNWVEDVGAASIVVLLIVLGLSTIGLWMQTKLLTKSAERQYREAARAFLHIDADEAEETTGRDGTPVLRIPIRCTNNGSTPTRHGLGHVNWHRFDGGGPETVSFNDLWTPETNRPSGIAIGPKGAINLDVEIPKAEILKSPGSVFCWGWVDYNDIFEESSRHRTEFCFEIARIDLGGKTEIRYQNYRLHNGYDDECYKSPALYERPVV